MLTFAGGVALGLPNILCGFAAVARWFRYDLEKRVYLYINMKTILARWKAEFVLGLSVVLPAAVSIGIVIWLFGTVATFTDTLLLFIPKAWTPARSGVGPTPFSWSLITLAAAILLISLVGRLARYYLGKQLIRLTDGVFMRVPLVNKLYSALKQIKDAFTSKQKTTFKQVVLVEFPRAGLYSIGFITGAMNGEVQAKSGQKLLSVFVPNPPLTSGSIVLAPEPDVVKLDMSVADGIKFIMSLGSVAPAYSFADGLLSPGALTTSEHIDSPGISPVIWNRPGPVPTLKPCPPSRAFA